MSKTVSVQLKTMYNYVEDFSVITKADVIDLEMENKQMALIDKIEEEYKNILQIFQNNQRLKYLDDEDVKEMEVDFQRGKEFVAQPKNFKFNRKIMTVLNLLRFYVKYRTCQEASEYNEAYLYVKREVESTKRY